MTVRIRMVCCCLMPLVACAEDAPKSGDGPESQVYVKIRCVRVGIDLRLGGAITHVSEPGGPNLINSYDLGRQIQQSYYSGPANYQREGKQKSPNWKTFPWNPIQTGDVYHHGSKVLDHRIRDGELYVKTVPMLWPMNDDPGECVMETWIKPASDAASFTYRARLSNARADRTHYGAHSQEVPAIYVNGPWHKLMTYNGDHPFAGEAVSEVRNDHREPWPWVRFVATEGWAALLNDAGTGIGVCNPRVMEFHGGFAGQRGSGDEKSPNTGYMSPIANEILDHNIVYEYSCTMVLGNLEQIRAEARRVLPKTLPAWKFDESRRGFCYENGRDSGWPVAGKGLIVKAIDKTRPVRLLGPITFWRAEAAGQVAVRISSKTAGTLKVFWRGMPPPAAATAPSAWAAWQNTWWGKERSAEAAIPVGTLQWVTLTLAGLPGYEGGLTGLAFDVPGGVTVHEVRLGGHRARKP